MSEIEYTTEDLVEVIDNCIEHWKENTEAAKEEFLGVRDIYSDNCALCQMTDSLSAGCYICPMQYFGYKCDEEDSPWMSVRNSLDGNTLDIVNACTTMLHVLNDVKRATKRFRLYIVRSTEEGLGLKEGYDGYSESS